MQWNEEFSTGNSHIDSDHKALYLMHDELVKAVEEKASPEELSFLLDKLTEFITLHFIMEEAIMNISKYPSYLAHQKHHGYLLNGIRDLATRFKNNPRVNATRFITYISSWFNDHLQGEDYRLGVWLRKNGVTHEN